MTTQTQTDLDEFTTDVGIAHNIIHGDANTVVQTNGGPVRSFAKLIADNQATFNGLGTGTLTDVGPVSGTTQFIVPTATGLFRSTLSTLAQWLLGQFLGITAIGSGATPRTLQDRGRDLYTVKDFGAAGDGVTDDTAAIQAAINAAIANKRGLLFPDGTYKITAALTIGVDNTSVVTGIRFMGQSRGGTIISQATANVPIFKLTGQYMHTMVWATMTLTYAAMQTGNTSARVFDINGLGSSSLYNCVFQDISASNFYWFMYCPTVLWWGNTYRDMWLGDFAGGVNYITGGGGEPNCRFERLYISCQSAIEILFKHNAMAAQYDNIEVNGANSGAAMLQDLAGGYHVIGHWALEGANYTVNTTLFNVTNSILLAKFIYTETISASAGVVVQAFSCGGSRSYINVEFYSVKGIGTLNGTLVAAQCPGPLPIRFKQCLMPWAANVQLLDVVGTTSADYVIVEDWNDPARVAINGDASVVLTMDAPLNQIFDTPLTAARTVTLPQGTAAATTVMFTGRRFRFTKTNTSAFALTIQDSSNNVIATIAAATRGIVELVWHRDGGAAGWSWIITDQRTY